MLDLRFVEKNKLNTEVQEIEKFPATIGKSRNRPNPPPYHTISLIPNSGSISGVHCSIEFDIKLNSWTIIDGIPGTPSTNGIFRKTRSDDQLERVSSCTISEVGDRVYLISTTDDREVYLEVYDPSITPPQNATQDIDPSIIKLKDEIVIEFDEKLEVAAKRGQARDARLDLIEKSIALGGGTLSQLDQNKGTMIRGGLVAMLLSLMLFVIAIGVIVVWKHEKMIDAFNKQNIEKEIK